MLMLETVQDRLFLLKLKKWEIENKLKAKQWTTVWKKCSVIRETGPEKWNNTGQNWAAFLRKHDVLCQTDMLIEESNHKGSIAKESI